MFKIHIAKDGKYYFTFTAKNGRVLVTSETYNRKSSMMKGIRSLKLNMANAIIPR